MYPDFPVLLVIPAEHQVYDIQGFLIWNPRISTFPIKGKVSCYWNLKIIEQSLFLYFHYFLSAVKSNIERSSRCEASNREIGPLFLYRCKLRFSFFCLNLIIWMHIANYRWKIIKKTPIYRPVDERIMILKQKMESGTNQWSLHNGKEVYSDFFV